MGNHNTKEIPMSEKKVSLDKELKNYAAIPAYPLANYILPYMGVMLKLSQHIVII